MGPQPDKYMLFKITDLNLDPGGQLIMGPPEFYKSVCIVNYHSVIQYCPWQMIAWSLSIFPPVSFVTDLSMQTEEFTLCTLFAKLQLKTFK